MKAHLGNEISARCEMSELTFVSSGGAREGKSPRGVRVLPANPRWERRVLKFLELSGVRRVMDEDAARAERLDGWIV